VYNKKPLERFTISLFGEKNISNAAGVVLTLLHLGYSEDRIRHAISGFSGVKRRFEKVAYTNHTYLFDDYAHHPEEIKATIQAARRRFTSRRIIAIFQPHTYSRTYELQNEFVDALSLADYSLIAPIFSSAREKGETINITSIDLENIAKNKGIMHIKAYTSVLDIIDTLREMIKPGDVVFTMGAGDIYKLKNDIIEVLKIVE
jgi:UDP-N-acetylmuramate--alanine ligase